MTQSVRMKTIRTAALSFAALLSSCTMVSEPGPPTPAPAEPSAKREAEVPRGETDPGLRPVLRPTPGTTPPVAAYTARPLPDEVRALWVVRTTLTHADSIRAMVERAYRAGFNTLIVQVRGRGDAYYLSRWEPRPEAILERGLDFDPLALVIREAHARGLGVHAWVNAYLIGGNASVPTDPLHLIRARPDLLAVPLELARDLFWADPTEPEYAEALLRYAQGNMDRIEGLYAAPSHPEVKEHLYSVWMDLAEYYDLDGLHFDYLRYPNPDFDYSRVALDRFRAWVSPRLSPARQTELDERYRYDPMAFVEDLPEPWDEFRRGQITELVERIYFGIRKRRPGLVVSAAVFPDSENAAKSRYQDWGGWMAAGILDAVAPMAYTPDNALFEEQIRKAVETAGGDKVWAGIGAYQNTYQGTLDKILIAGRLGARGVSLFSYDWAVSEGESDGARSLLDRLGSAAFGRR
jgi:uncharacterized lipoprotein YddW (UPF0748 family)